MSYTTVFTNKLPSSTPSNMSNLYNYKSTVSNGNTYHDFDNFDNFTLSQDVSNDDDLFQIEDIDANCYNTQVLSNSLPSLVSPESDDELTDLEEEENMFDSDLINSFDDTNTRIVSSNWNSNVFSPHLAARTNSQLSNNNIRKSSKLYFNSILPNNDKPKNTNSTSSINAQIAQNNYNIWVSAL